MSEMIPINLAVEDVLSEFALRKILRTSGRTYEVQHCYGLQGNGYLKKSIVGFNRASQVCPFLLLTDLDRGECAPILQAQWLTVSRDPNFLFRVAVREVEAWLLADRESIAGFFGVSLALVPRDPESLDDPKRELIGLASRSRRRDVREAIVPAPKTTARQGPDYNACLIRYIETAWNPLVAQHSADSLKRTLNRLSEFQPLARTSR